jgi:HSP20 family protein
MFPSFFDEVFEQAAKQPKDLIYKPAANVSENNASFGIEIALPGFEKEEISMKVEKETLTISAGIIKNETETTTSYAWQEFGKSGKYIRSFILPESVKSDEITAEYTNGVLKVTLPKKEINQVSEREIPIA